MIVGCFSRGRRRYDTHLVIVAQRTKEGGAWRTRVAQQFYDDNECSLTTTDEGFRFTAPTGVLEASPSSLTTNFDLGSVKASISTGPGGPLESRGLARVEVDALAPALPLCGEIDEIQGDLEPPTGFCTCRGPVRRALPQELALGPGHGYERDARGDGRRVRNRAPDHKHVALPLSNRRSSVVLPHDGPADFLRRGLRRGRGVLTVGIKTEFRRGEAEAGVDLHRAPFIILGASTARREKGSRIVPARASRLFGVRACQSGSRRSGGRRADLRGRVPRSLEGHNYPRGSIYLGEASSFLATSTAFNAAPRSSWSPQMKKSRPFSPKTSLRRMRPTSTS